MDKTITISVAVISHSVRLLSHRVIRCRTSQLYHSVISLLCDYHDRHPSCDIRGANIYIIEFGYYRFVKYKKPRVDSSILCNAVDNLPY